MQVPQDRVASPRLGGITRALHKRQPVAFAVAVYRNGGRAVADCGTGYWSGAQKRVKAGEEESKRDEGAPADDTNHAEVIVTTKELGHRSFSEALKRSIEKIARAHMPTAPKLKTSPVRENAPVKLSFRKSSRFTHS
jgi:hypothetical protein